MNNWVKLLFCAVAAVSFPLGLVGQTASAASESPLLQAEHIPGDQYQGFEKSCVIVYSDGRFHRERRNQVSQGGHAQDAWEAPQVFEGQLGLNSIERLRALIENPELRLITGSLGEPPDLFSKLVFGASGVIPHSSIEILTVSIAHPNHPQLFEVADTRLAQRQPQVNAVLQWIVEALHFQAARLKSSASNNCAALSDSTAKIGFNTTSIDTGFYLPVAIKTAAPSKLPNSAIPHEMTVDFIVNPDGTVSQASVADRANPVLSKSMLDAVEKWNFHPARLLGVPIAFRMTVKIAAKKP